MKTRKRSRSRKGSRCSDRRASKTFSNGMGESCQMIPKARSIKITTTSKAPKKSEDFFGRFVKELDEDMRMKREIREKSVNRVCKEFNKFSGLRDAPPTTVFSCSSAYGTECSSSEDESSSKKVFYVKGH